MKNFNLPMFLLATLVILMFVMVGGAIAMENIWLIILFIILGFGFMGLGLTIKRKRK
ncbi:MAG TPA: DUF5325 family protein [Virgibacillus sp.]|nr:DUF5325 family protein [Virgibacillus sp.]